ncbi:MAG: anti-sigma factor [Desulfobacteraceae bacterium]|nr:anti-sigma factor [Desulfobacteraceae bacterium]
MKCAKVAKSLSPYVDGELGETERREVETHLAQCGRCAGELAEARRLQQLLSQAERFAAPPGFRAEVMARIDGRSSPGLSWSAVSGGMARAFVVVAAITAGVMSGSLLARGIAPPQKGAPLIETLGLEVFEALPPGSLGRAYLALTEERR